MSKKLVRVLALVCVVGASFPFTNDVRADAPKKAWVYTTNLSGDKGLDYCGDAEVTGCLHSLVIDGSEVVKTLDYSQADYVVAGGVYGRTCRLVDTKAAPCEASYLRIYPRNPSDEMQLVTIGFRRLLSDDPTSSIGVALTNGLVNTFEPATAEIGDIATLALGTNELEWDGDFNCLGYVPIVDGCDIDDVGSKTISNQVDVLFIPSHLSNAVPPDIGPGCAGPDDPTGCWVMVFELNGVGSWMDTNSSFYGPTESTRASNGVQFRLGGPHFRTGTDLESASDADLNLGWYRSFMTTSYLKLTYGLSPEQASAETLPVRKVSSGVTTIPEVTYQVVPGGLLVTTSNISYSIPAIQTSRNLDVEVGERLSSSAIIASAGLSSVQKFHRSSISVKSNSGIRRRGSSYTFTRPGTFQLTLKYKTAKRSRLSTRTISVSVGT